MSRLNDVTGRIKILKDARDILKEKYSQSEFHKKKETHPHSAVPPSPEDEEIYKLLNAIQQLDKYVKELEAKAIGEIFAQIYHNNESPDLVRRIRDIARMFREPAYCFKDFTEINF